MLKFILICALLAIASGEHQGHGHEHVQSHGSSDDAHADIKHYDSNIFEDGFHYGFETTNHIKTFAVGDVNGNVHGDFQWISPEGENIEVNYIADENGYQPKSDALPTSPPTPEAILRSLEYIASHPHDKFDLHEGRRI